MKRPLYYLLAALLALWLACPLKLGIVLGSSMAPSLRNRQIIVINESYYKSHRPHTGDVVVLRHGGEMLVKRIVALQGDRLWEVRDPEIGSYLLLSAHDVGRMRRALRRSPQIGSLRQVVVPRGFVYVLGDAGQTSLDSRSFGPVALSDVKGRVLGL